jgi:hypothetical protein
MVLMKAEAVVVQLRLVQLRLIFILLLVERDKHTIFMEIFIQ